MRTYYFKEDTFVIKNYQNAKVFSSFLPAVAGEEGKPLWAFYASVGQVMGGFGLKDKETPITPFDSATLAYQNIPIRSFRTFLRVNNKVHAPFFNKHVSQTMFVDKEKVSISENTSSFKTEITYTSVPFASYPGLIRKVTITSNLKETAEVEILDGLPIFFPHGLSNFAYKELVSLMAAYCEIHNTENKAPFVKFKTSTGDHAIVEENVSGNAFVSLDDQGKLLHPIVDLSLVFGGDLTLLSPEGFLNRTKDEFKRATGQLENKMPCAFSYTSKTLKPHETFTFYSLFGTFDNIEQFKDVYTKLTPSSFEKHIRDNKSLIDKLLAPLDIQSGDKAFDKYMKQTFLDNNLRGGFPTLLDNGNGGEVYYIYSRKHGDMERDYNQFSIPSKYYSSGPGNFRDVNQNRRNDLYFYPFVKDYNIKLFFNLIQIDGQNPLNVAPLRFIKLAEFDETMFAPYFTNKCLFNDALKLLNEGYEPSAMFTLLKDNEKHLTTSAKDLFATILGLSKQIIVANFAEGYWVDHWTYNLDLLENYASVYPDKMKDLLLDNDYAYFFSLVSVEPRSEKYCLLPDGKIRQYGAIDLNKVRKENEKYGYDLKKTYWLKTKDGTKVTTTLAAKILNLITMKFATLDNLGIGIEMECEKPGWNDAMNGMPGLFGSGVSESVELLRLVNFALAYFPLISDHHISILSEQFILLSGVEKLLKLKNSGTICGFTYWDEVATLREAFRENVHLFVSGKTKELPVSKVIRILRLFKLTLEEGLVKAREIGNGLLPAYLWYEASKYEENNYTNHLGYKSVTVKEFKLHTLPPFMEANARVLKLGPKYNNRESIKLIKQTDIYDSVLGTYKTCAALDAEPFEIGRIHAFTKGWLERECNFLHMTYKYLLGLLKSGFIKEYYQEAKNNLVYLMDPHVYGRSPIENTSFIVPTCNPDKSNHGRGFFARLTGANAEMLNIYTYIFFGPSLFKEEHGSLIFTLHPQIDKSFFDEKHEIKVKLFNNLEITYYNPHLLNFDDKYKLIYSINGKTYDVIKDELAHAIRDGKITKLKVEYVYAK